jgi:uracil-DNA glycosylase
MDEEFKELDLLIGKCRKCEGIIEIIKHENLERGGKSKIIIVGQNPGKTESKTGKAFSGNAGKRLFKWLQEASIGIDEDDIRKKVYFTSYIKCNLNDKNNLHQVYSNCEPFLKQQIQLVKAEILITLGPEVFNILFNRKSTSNSLIGNYFNLNQLENLMFPEMTTFPGIKYVLPLPHPSGLNRWPNEKENIKKISRALTQLNLLYYDKS